MATLLLLSKCAPDTIKSVSKDLEQIISTVKEDKFDLKRNFSEISEYMDLNDCTTSIFFECTNRMTRMWLTTETVSMKFRILNIISVYGLCSTTNYHYRSGHILSFSEDFDGNEQLIAVKKMLSDVFSTDTRSPAERMVCFFYVDGSVHMRQYLVDGVQEIGPRIEFALEKILDGCYKGNVVYNRIKTE